MLSKATRTSKSKFESVADAFAPSFDADALEGQTVEGKIVEIEDWQHGKKKGTTLHLQNGDFLFRVPLYTVIANKLARYQGKKELDRKKALGMVIQLTGLGRGSAKKGQSAPALFDVAVA